MKNKNQDPQFDIAEKKAILQDSLDKIAEVDIFDEAFPTTADLVSVMPSVVVETKYGADEIRALDNLVFASLKRLVIFAIGLAFIFLLPVFVLTWVEGEYPNVIATALLGTFIILGTIFFIFMHMQLAAQLKKINPKSHITIRFLEYSFYVKIIGRNERVFFQEISYKSLENVIETKTHYFIYIARLGVHVVPKKDIVEGSPTLMRELLKYKHLNGLLAKYKIKTKTKNSVLFRW